MAGKISEYTTEQTNVDDTDRLDISTDLAGTPTTKYLSYGTLKTNLTNDGFASDGDNVSNFANDAGYITSVPSGALGIANTSGVYTFYADFAAANAAASAGDTIQLFADITETSAVSVILKNGVSYNFNGHTYTLSNSGTNNAFELNGTGTEKARLFNGRIVRTGGGTPSTANSAGLFAVQCTIEANRFIVENDFGAAVIGQTPNLIGFNMKGETYGYYGSGVSNVIEFCKGEGNSQAGIYALGGDLRHCIGRSVSGAGIHCRLTAEFCYGFSSGFYGIEILNSAKISHCVGESTGNNGIRAQDSEVSHCKGISTSNEGMLTQNSTVYNCYAFSSATQAFQTQGGGGATILNNTFISTAANAATLNIGSNIDTIRFTFSGNFCKTTAASQHCLLVTNATSNNSTVISKNKFDLVSAANYSISAGGVAKPARILNNEYSDVSTTPVDPLLTQLQTNAADTFGNIQIG